MDQIKTRKKLKNINMGTAYRNTTKSGTDDSDDEIIAHKNLLKAKAKIINADPKKNPYQEGQAALDEIRKQEEEQIKQQKIKEKEKLSKNAEKSSKNSEENICSWITQLFFAILTLVIGGLVAFFFKDLTKLFNKESSYSETMQPIREIFLDKFSGFKTDFSNQPVLTYDVINSTVLNVLESRNEPESPGVILLLGTEGNELNLRKIELRLTKILLDTFEESHQEEYSFDCKRKANSYSKSVDEIKERIDSGIRSILDQKKFMVISNLDYMHAEAVPMLQHFFDHENAPFKNAIYLLTALTKERFSGRSIKHARNMAYEYFDRVWDLYPVEHRNAMYSRLFNSVAIIVPEIE